MAKSAMTCGIGCRKQGIGRPTLLRNTMNAWAFSSRRASGDSPTGRFRRSLAAPSQEPAGKGETVLQAVSDVETERAPGFAQAASGAVLGFG